ncbi:MAG TPA: EamA family transporter [Ktedonobacterales bacterium]
MLSALAFMALYIVLFGVAALLEQPIARGLDAFHLDALLRIGAAVLAIAALLVLRGPALTSWAPALAGVSIGLISGAGSLCYCLALGRLPADLTACLANGYLVVTVVLGIVVLHEPLTLFTLAGLVLTIGGAVVLTMRSHAGRRAAVSHHATEGGARFALVASPSLSPHSMPGSTLPLRLSGISWLAGYVALIGVGAFLEKPALRQLAPLQLNALTALGMVIVGLLAVSMVRVTRRRHRSGPLGSRHLRLPALGIGLMIGAGSIFYYLALAHLPVSTAAALANAYVVVTVVLAVPVFHQPMTWRKAAGVVAMLVGVVLLSLRVPL